MLFSVLASQECQLSIVNTNSNYLFLLRNSLFPNLLLIPTAISTCTHKWRQTENSQGRSPCPGHDDMESWPTDNEGDDDDDDGGLLKNIEILIHRLCQLERWHCWQHIQLKAHKPARQSSHTSGSISNLQDKVHMLAVQSQTCKTKFTC